MFCFSEIALPAFHSFPFLLTKSFNLIFGSRDQHSPTRQGAPLSFLRDHSLNCREEGKKTPYKRFQEERRFICFIHILTVVVFHRHERIVHTYAHGPDSWHSPKQKE